MSDLKFAIFGTGFWSQFQLAAWRELQGAECVALYNRTVSKAEALAERFGVPAVYGDPEELLEKEKPDFVDIITDVGTHAKFTKLAAAHRVPVICQKPMAPSLAVAEEMVAVCRDAGVPLAIHENWRWQWPIRQLKRLLKEGRIGKVFQARVKYSCSFPVFENQPFLRDVEQFIVADMGSHLLDASRFLFGEAERLFCLTRQVHKDIKGEDVATVMMDMVGGATVLCEMSYASRLENERFPETYIYVEGEKGSAELGPDYWIRVTDENGTFAKRYPPPHYPWADPAYDVVHASIVPCNENLLEALRTGRPAETSGEDNLKTVKLVFACYDSAAAGEVIEMATYPQGA